MAQTTERAPERRRRKQMKGWQRFLLCWRLPMVIVLILLLLCGILVGTVTHKLTKPAAAPSDTPAAPTAGQLYDAAVLDAMRAENDEIHDLVCLTADDENATVDENGVATLVVWHNTPDLYPKGEAVGLDGHDLTTFTDKEFSTWYKAHKSEMNADAVTRMEQLLGLAPATGNTHFTVIRANVSKILRPAYQSDITKNEMTTSFSVAPDVDYQSWFNANIISSYFDGARPWTRLGYTYDWADDDSDYGLTEFMISGENSVQVVATYTNEEFLTLIKKGRAVDAE